MKNIISFEEEIVLPKCMYRLKNPIDINEKDTEINISDQVTKFLKVYFKLYIFFYINI